MEKFNGWKNYETWLCNLWLQESMHDLQYYNAGELHDEFAEHIDELSDYTTYNKFFKDILFNALERIDFQEIIDNAK